MSLAKSVGMFFLFGTGIVMGHLIIRKAFSGLSGNNKNYNQRQQIQQNQNFNNQQQQQYNQPPTPTKQDMFSNISIGLSSDSKK